MYIFGELSVQIFYPFLNSAGCHRIELVKYPLHILDKMVSLSLSICVLIVSGTF